MDWKTVQSSPGSTPFSTSLGRVMYSRGDLGLMLQSFSARLEWRKRGKPFSCALSRLFSLACQGRDGLNETGQRRRGWGKGHLKKSQAPRSFAFYSFYSIFLAAELSPAAWPGSAGGRRLLTSPPGTAPAHPRCAAPTLGPCQVPSPLSPSPATTCKPALPTPCYSPAAPEQDRIVEENLQRDSLGPNSSRNQHPWPHSLAPLEPCPLPHQLSPVP